MRRFLRFLDLSKFEYCLWVVSVLVSLAAFFIARQGVLQLLTTLVGVTALIFVAKGRVLGQVLTVLFAVLYAAVSYDLRYYGEMITYLFMTAPMALFAVISWLRHPYSKKEVAVGRLSRGKLWFLLLGSVSVTALFYFLLRALGNASLAVSTLSITTSFLASALTFFRHPLYAVGYAANDIVLIVLWVIAVIDSPAYFTMVACFLMFFLNDVYGYLNWRRMQKRQNKSAYG
ncbi:MAG: nicotinamide mononucleotide transporter [Clostridia bacterium]|nr:nicotinamide mononucleotide transporter [Clostridia bacterium]